MNGDNKPGLGDYPTPVEGASMAMPQPPQTPAENSSLENPLPTVTLSDNLYPTHQSSGTTLPTTKSHKKIFVIILSVIALLLIGLLLAYVIKKPAPDNQYAQSSLDPSTQQELGEKLPSNESEFHTVQGSLRVSGNTSFNSTLTVGTLGAPGNTFVCYNNLKQLSTCTQAPGSAVGIQGPAGPRGANGTDGVNGRDGASGRDGATGATGATGLQGPPGPAGSGSGSNNASDLTTGTLDPARLSSNVALLDRNNQVFTGQGQVFRNSANTTAAFSLQRADGVALFNLDTVNRIFTLEGDYVTLNVDNVYSKARFDSELAAASWWAESSWITGESGYRFARQADGTMLWGNGTDPFDTNLYRLTADVLKTDDSLVVQDDLWVRDNTAIQVGIGSMGPTGQAGIGFGNGAAGGWGDANIWRSAQSVLNTDSYFIHQAGLSVEQVPGARGSFYIDTFGGGPNIVASGWSSNGSDRILTAGMDGEADGRLQVLANGTIQFGSGTGTDTNLYRSAADTLKTDDNFAVGSNMSLGNGASIDSNIALNILNTHTDLTGGKVGLSNYGYFNPTANSTNGAAGIDNEMFYQGNYDYLANIGGQYTEARKSGSGTASYLYGNYTRTQNTGTGTISGMNSVVGEISSSAGTVAGAAAIEGWAAISGTGSLTSGQALKVSVANGGSGTFGTGYGVLVQSATNSGGGLFENNYGVYIQDQSAVGSVNSYNLYSAGTNASNLIQGNLQVGSTVTADAKVSISNNYSDHINTQYNQLIVNGAANTGSVNGSYIYGQNATGQTINWLVNHDAEVYLQGAGNTNELANYYSWIENSGAGTADKLHGLKIDGIANSGTGAINNAYGVSVANLLQGTNNYAYYTDLTTGANNYAFYGAGTAKSYLGGALETAESLYVGNRIFNDAWDYRSSSTNLLHATYAAGKPTGTGIIQTISGAGAEAYSLSVVSYVENPAATSLSGAVAIDGSVVVSGNGDQDFIRGLQGYVYKEGAGVINHAESIRAHTIDSTAGTINNAYGLRVSGQSAGTNNYGVYIDQAAGASNYALYSAGTAKSYFAGSLATGGILQPVMVSSSVWSSGLEGGIIYDDTANKLYVYDNGAKKEICNATDGCGAGTDLQAAYNASSSPAIIETSSAAKNFIIKSGTGFNSTGAFQVQRADGAQILNVDTVNARLGIATATPEASLHIAGAASIRLEETLLEASPSFSDNFNRANNASLGSDWIERCGDFDIATNLNDIVTSCSAGLSTAIHSAGPYNTANYSVEAKVRVNGSWQNDWGVVGRRVDNGATDSDGYFLAVSAGDWLRLYKRVGGVNTTLATYTVNLNGSTFYTVKLSMNGSTIKGYLDGVERISVNDSTFTSAGTAGIATNAITSQNSNGAWDDFVVGSVSLSVNKADLKLSQDKVYLQSSSGSDGMLATFDLINNRLGLGTSSPTATLDARGNALFQNSTNTTTAFQVLSSTSAPLLNVDTLNANVSLGLAAYNTGTISQTGTAITGSGTTFTSTMNGGTITYSDGTSATVTYVSATSLTSSVSKTVAAGSSYLIQYGGLKVTSTGAVTARNVSDSSTAFQIQNATGSTNVFTADTANSRIGIGTSSPQATLHVAGVADSFVRIQKTGASGSPGFSDNFDRADSTNIGSSWVENTGDFDILSNKLRLPTGSATANAYNNSAAYSTADYQVEATISIAVGSNAVGVAARMTPSGGSFSGYYAVLEYGNAVRVGKRVGGVNTTLGSYTGVGPTGTQTIKLEVEGSTIKAYYNGVERVNVTDTSISTPGVAGIMQTTTVSGNQWDNFNVTYLTASQSAADLRHDNNMLFVQNSSAVDGDLATFDLVNNRFGLGTDAPTTTLDVRGNALFRSEADSASAFLVQNQNSESIFGVNTSDGQVNIHTLTAADANARLTVGTGATGKKGLVIQGVAGQTADMFQIQNSTGSVLAKIDAGGNLTVASATINGNLTVSGGITTSYAHQTANHTVTATDSVVSADATSGVVTVTLPSAVGITGRQYTIKRTNSGANNVTVATTSSQTIDGATTHDLTTQYATITVVSDGSNWLIIGKL